MQSFTATLGAIDQKEALRYLGYQRNAPTEEVEALLVSCADEMLPKLNCRALWEVYPLQADGDRLDLGFATVTSHSLSLNLAGCRRVALFAATIGVDVDRLIAKYERLSPAKGACMQALGAAAVEQFCDLLNAEIDKAFPQGTRPRFSCGYGDLPITLQRDIFAALPVEKRLGMTLSSQCFMSPVKSVTALIGIL